MDFEGISRNLSSSMDPKNVTALLMSLIVQFGRKARTTMDDAANGAFLINHQELSEDEDDADIILAYNLTEILVRNYQHDVSLLYEILKNLNNEENRWREEANRRLSDHTFNVIIPIYILVIAIGFFGNLLVVTAAIRQKTLRTPRNAFIINLAVSDILLCLVTMPLTLVEIVNDHWPLGDSVVSCKAAGGFQAVSVFVSTISITAIALDRYQLIVYPEKDFLKRIGATAVLSFIWFLGFLLASPIFMVRTIKHHDFNSPKRSADVEKHPYHSGGVHSIDFCYEKWPVSHGRAIYSAFTLVIQYTLPILIISVLHTKICQRLRTRQTAMEVMVVQDTQKRMKEAKLLRRRHNLLIAIALVFSITWLPLNVLNLFLDLYSPSITHPYDEEKMTIIYAACHLFGMSSACVNPFLYGWFNGNFRNEFTEILGAPLRLLNCHNSYESYLPPSHQAAEVAGSSSSVAIRSSTAALPDQICSTHPAVHHFSIEMVEGSNKIVCSLGHPAIPMKADCINKVDYRTSEALLSSIRPIKTDYDKREVQITNPMFSSRLDVEMVDVEEPSTSTNNNSLALIRKEESMETFL